MTPRSDRIGHRDRERASFALEREHQVALRQLGGDQLRDARIDLEVREVDGGHPELAREHARELDLVDEAELHEVVADAHAAGFLFLKRPVHCLARDEPLAHEEITETFTRGYELLVRRPCFSEGEQRPGASATPPGRGVELTAGLLL